MIGKTIALCAMLAGGAALAAEVDEPDEPAPNHTSCPRGEILRVKLHTCVPKGGSLDITSRGKGWVVEGEDGARVRPRVVHREPRREASRPYKVQIIQDTVKFVPLPDPPPPPAAVAVAPAPVEPVAPEPVVPKIVRVIPLSAPSSGPLASGPPSWAGTLTIRHQ